MSTKSSPEIPFLLNKWLQVGRAVPAFKIRGVDFGFCLATFLFLGLLRWATIALLLGAFGWPRDDMEIVNKGASSLVPIFHSGNLVPALWYCFQSHKYSPSERFDVAPAWWQEVVHLLLQFCTGYMMYDIVFSILVPKMGNLLEGDDWVFLVHHIVTSIYMTSTRFIGAGHQSAMICMLLGEATNPFHNLYYFLQEAMKLSCCNGSLAQTILDIDTFMFASTYVIIRALVAPPILMFHVSYDLLMNGRKNIPIWVSLIWILLIWGVSIGSYPWIELCWGLVRKYLTGAEEGAAEL